MKPMHQTTESMLEYTILKIHDTRSIGESTYHVAVTIKRLDTSQQLLVVAHIDQHLGYIGGIYFLVSETGSSADFP